MLKKTGHIGTECEGKVQLSKHGIKVNGKSEIILCASLFYFRIPREEWKDRIVKLKNAGYNCVDVYFPWNFHEISSNEWSFEGQRDIDAFLKMLADENMYVVARPGPYICSEWDGGSIPAWVLTDENIKLRCNDSGFMRYVNEWYSKVLPIICKYQIGKQGTVILMQLDNELDFYDCHNPREYINALKDIAREYGIVVPLFGCAGQGNVEGATGWADDVEITFNFYGDIKDPAYEDRFHYYYQRLYQLDKPLMITETACSHLFLRRQLAAGAKLLGPYNQVGGTNFGFTGSVNNWGGAKNPLSFIPTHYWWGGIIGSAGELNNEYLEGRLFSGFLRSFGESLSEARSHVCSDIIIEADFLTSKKHHVLELKNGGKLVCIPNLDSKDGTARIKYDTVTFDVRIKAGKAPFIPLNIPFDVFGIEGEIIYSDCELSSVASNNDLNEVEMVFTAEFDSGVVKLLIDGKTITVNGVKSMQRVISDGKKLTIRIEKSDEFVLGCFSNLDRVDKPIPTKYEVYDAFKKAYVSENIIDNMQFKHAKVSAMEKLGVYRGFAAYKMDVRDCSGLLLFNVADLLLAVKDGGYFDGRVLAGCTQYYNTPGEYTFITAIWGHSNFDDSRQPSLRMKSAKGIQKAVKVLKTEELDSNWFFSYFEGNLDNTLTIPQRAIETVVSVNSWNTTRVPVSAVYRKIVDIDASCDVFAFELKNNAAQCRLYIDGVFAGSINPLDPFIDISRYVSGKKSAEISIHAVKKDWGEHVGTPVLYSGMKIDGCSFASVDEKQIISFADVECGRLQDFPIVLEKGQINVIELPFENLGKSGYINIKGRDMFVAFIIGEMLLGRTILEWEKRPVIAGDCSRIYLPESYSRNQNTIKLLTIGLGENPQIEKMFIEYI